MSTIVPLMSPRLFTSAEDAARTATYKVAKERIAAIQSHEGTALPPGSTAPPPSVAAKNAHPSGKSPTLLSEIFGGEVIPGEGDIEGALKSIAPPTPSQVGEEAVKGAIGLVEPIAKKLTLYGVLIFGAVAMVIFGVSELLKPVGGPDLAGSAKKAAGSAFLKEAAA